MAKKFNAAVFASITCVNNPDGTLSGQDSITIIAETSASRGFSAVTVAVESTPTDTFAYLRILHATNQIAGNNNDSEFQQILNSLILCSNIVPQSMLSSGIAKIVLTEKLDRIFYKDIFKKTFNLPYSLNDKDTNGLKLIDFLKSIDKSCTLDGTDKVFEFLDTDLVDFKRTSNLATRKFAVPRNAIDFNVFWNSLAITPDEKDYCKPRGDLDICMSNSYKDVFKILMRLSHVAYPERNWNLNILFGDPSSGKTTMIENLCFLLGAPFVKLTGDPTISMTKMIMTVGPENVQRTITKSDLINKALSLGFTNADITSMDDEINKTILALNSKECDVQLTEQESIILKCKKNGLPLVVLLDECNMYTTLLQATLADVITSGYVNVGVHTYKDNPSNIIWFCAYNPNTYKAFPFEGKFRDRALFFCSEMPTQEQIIDHKQRKVSAALFGTTSVLSSLQEQLDEIVSNNPDKAEQLQAAFNLVTNICSSTTPSPEAVQWFFDFKVSEILNSNVPTFKEGDFSDYYLNDCKLDSPANVKEAVARIIKLISKVNELLKTLTKGIDTKNPDSNFYFYIPNRAYDYVTDLIFCFTSVAKAIYFIVYNLIPNGDTVRYNTSLNPAKDIAESITTTLSNEISDLQQFLFTNVNDSEVDSEYSKLLAAKFDPKLWISDDESVDILSGENVSFTAVNSSAADDPLDEAEDLLG